MHTIRKIIEDAHQKLVKSKLTSIRNKSAESTIRLVKIEHLNYFSLFFTGYYLYLFH